MKGSIKPVLCLLLAFCISSNSLAQDEASLDEIIVSFEDESDPSIVKQKDWDRSTIVVPDTRTIDWGTLEKYSDDVDFDYGERPKFEETWWQRLKRLIREWIYDTIGYDGVRTFNDVIYYILVVVGIIALVFFLTKVRARKMLKREGQKETVMLHDDFNEVEGIDFDAMINNAEKQKNNRLAVRLRYLRLLQLLDIQGLITWKDYKTNIDYSYELKNKKIRRQFNELTRYFEQAWYGHFDIDDQRYASWKSAFELAHQFILKNAA